MRQWGGPVDIKWEGGRSITVTHEDGETFKVMASSETGSAKRNHTTWRWEHSNKRYRIQIQVTNDDEWKV